MFKSCFLELVLNKPFLYILDIYLPKNIVLKTKTKIFEIPKGSYLYLGSAPSPARVYRHLMKEKKKHWHIDFLLDFAEIKGVFIKASKGKECSIGKFLGKKGIKGFGNSDCKDYTHLFFKNKEVLEKIKRKGFFYYGKKK